MGVQEACVNSAKIADYFERSRLLVERICEDRAFLDSVCRIADRIIVALREGNKLLLAGNGGSAADAQHIAAELLSRFRLDRNPLPAIALTTDTSVLTAIGNDYDFGRIFERQIRGLGRGGDVFIAISTSGRSANVIRALEAAKELGLATIGFTGANTDALQRLCDVLLTVPSQETALIQQVHMIAAHAICEQVEATLFPH